MLQAIKTAQIQFEKFENDRKLCLELSNILRAESKAAINFLVKGMEQKGKKELAKTPEILKKINKLLQKDPYLNTLLALNEGLEEYAEAIFLLTYIEKTPRFPSPTDLQINHEAYISGLCDMTGELVRIARKNPEQLQKIHDDISNLYDQCIGFYVKRNSRIRNKLEDLERNLRRLEEMVYAGK
jgi:predicted translin family RNA/ssDNA-binding protein